MRLALSRILRELISYIIHMLDGKKEKKGVWKREKEGVYNRGNI